MKDNILPVNTGLSIVDKLKPVEFNFKGPNKNKQSGFLAQDVSSVLPHLVTTAPSLQKSKNHAVDPNTPTDLLSLDSIGMIPYLVKALQELHAQVTTLQSQVVALQSQISPPAQH